MDISKRKVWPTLIASAIAAEFGIQHSQAATIYVDNQNCQLHDAITAANSDAVAGGCAAGDGDDVIELPANSKINIDSRLPFLTSNITINANGTTIKKSDSAPNYPVFTTYNSQFILNDATITNGLANVGGAIRCRPIDSGNGCKIYRSSFLNNSAIFSGGAIYFFASEQQNTDHAIVDSYFSGNATIRGAAIRIYSYYDAPPVIISNSTFTGNSATGNGGAISFEGYYTGQTPGIIISNSTFSGNTSGGIGGAILATTVSDAMIQIDHSTIVFNSATSEGGGISVKDGNFTGGIVSLEMTGNIISGNQSSSGQEVYTSTFTSVVSDYNILGTLNDPGIEGFQLSNSDLTHQSTTDTILDVNLADNGGATKTHALVLNSPAIDFVSICDITEDQTGTIRPADGNNDGLAICDAGSVEFITPFPDLAVTVQDRTVALFETFEWLYTITNSGTSDLHLGSGTTVLSTSLPDDNFLFSGATFSNGAGTTGALECQITDNDLICVVDSPLSMAPGAEFHITVPTQATQNGTYEFGFKGETCVDPDNVLEELSENNNACFSQVRVHDPVDLSVDLSAPAQYFANYPFTWTFVLNNLGPGSAAFADDTLVFSTSIPSTGFEYSDVLIEMPEIAAGQLNCVLQNQNSELVCSAQAGFVLPSMTTTNIKLQGQALQTHQISIPVDQQQPCQIDPTEYFSDLTLKNNNCQGKLNFVDAPDLIFGDGFDDL